jgi:hypothetical protein
MDEPAARASEAVAAYRNHLLGAVGAAARSVAARLDANDATGESFLGVRGPYLQALPPANWSERSWPTFAREAGLSPLVRLAFENLGFRRLYDFQERTVEAVRQGDDTVVTAATGRGKTEAWLIPILDQIIQANRGKHSQMDPDDVKAVLLYPTKALAQDQLKRLLGYLYRINVDLPSDHRITVGIYDGDTPRDPSQRAEGYLNDTFEQFSCPGYDERQAKCQSCGRGVNAEATTGGYRLRPEKANCIDDVPLDFVRLTKREILTEGVDILLTNPDTINLKLLNTNASEEHERFVYEPKFLVYDEVHTYDGLFGSYTATLTKRLRTLRERRDGPSLQVIAASATVDNDVALFRKLSGSADVTHVDEQPRELDPPATTTVPPALTDDRLSEADLLTAVREARSPSGLPTFDPTVPADADRDRLREVVGDELFEHLTAADPPSESVAAIQSVHALLREEPATPEELRDRVAAAFDTDEATTETLVANVRTLCEFSGLLERRSHLFTWPLDGFYACAGCDAVYRSPHDNCPACGEEFLTRARYCRRCDEEHLVAWTCPGCRRLTPYVPNEDGTPHGRDRAHCPHCGDGDETEGLTEATGPRLDRVTFRPIQACTDCGASQRRGLVKECDCGTRLVRTDADTLVCRDPTCDRKETPGLQCRACGSDRLELQRTDRDRLRPWVCGNDDCDRQLFQPTPPETCRCDWNGSFVQTGLVESFETTVCQTCGKRVADGDCACAPADAEHVQESNPEGRLAVVDGDGRRRDPGNFETGSACRHAGLGYDADDRYDELVRSPNNLAVTTSQYLLRRVADEEGNQAAKLLAFADSHRDMKELDRDFSEPEAETVLDQALVAAVGETTTDNDTMAEDGGADSSRASHPTLLSDHESNSSPVDESDLVDGAWRSLEATVDGATSVIQALDDAFDPPARLNRVSFDLLPELLGRVHRRFDDPAAAVRERLHRRAVPHAYRPQLRERGGSLAEAGLLDVRFAPERRRTLSDAERAVVRNVVDVGDGCHVDQIDPPGYSERVTDVVTALADAGVLVVRDEEYVRFDPSALEVTVAGVDDGLAYDPDGDAFVTTLERQFGLANDESVPSETSLTERADPTEPLFTQRAYRLVASSPRVLISRVYHGLTDKRDRRALEYLFRDGSHPHFLSSGPTMELGVDIGELDALLLYGTPPNVNAYLQRVGRAGRESGSSLVHSVSQRNPIDFYYYDNPTELIESEPKPVPLSEHNESVLEVSLTWAVFDYIAAEFVIPWEVEYPGGYGKLSGGATVRRRRETNDEEYAKLTQLLSLPVSKLDLDSRDRGVAALATVVDDHREELLSHLADVLGYRYCRRCARKYDRGDQAADDSDSVIETCRSDNCDGRVVDAPTEFAGLRERVVDQFTELFVDEYDRYRSDLETELTELERETTSLRRQVRRATGGEATTLRRRRDAIKDRRQALRERLERIEGMEYGEFLQESRAGKFAFNMRNVDGSVAVSLVTHDGDSYERTALGDGYGGRSERMALSELHPGAAYLEDGTTHVVTRARFDEFESSELRRYAERTDNERLATELVCPGCNSSHPVETTACDCASERSLKRRRLASLEAVEAHRDDLVTCPGGDPARAVYDSPDEEVQNTFAERTTDVLSFEPRQTFELVTDDGVVGQVAFGDYTVLAHTDNFRARYKSGAADADDTPFEVCGADTCGGIVYRDDDGRGHCTADADHDPRDVGSEFVRLGYSFETEGVRVTVDDPTTSHAFGHGLRVALQSLGGVGIREVTEVVDDDHTDVFDATPGGANVTRQLVTERENGFPNFQTATAMIADQFDCSCEAGCPRCLFQYGCATHNRPETLARDDAAAVARTTRLRRVDDDPPQD